MNYTCPRCNKPMALAETNSVIKRFGVLTGGIGAIIAHTIYVTFCGFRCTTCGKIPFGELPSQAKTNYIGLVFLLVFIVAIITVFVLLGLGVI